MKKLREMKLRTKIGVVVASGATVIAGAGVAFAYFTTTGSGSGTGAAGSAGSWNVSNVTTSGGTLYPGQGSDTISATVQNATGHGAQGLDALNVTIGTPTNTDSSGNFSVEPACTAADFALNAANGSGWSVTGATATYTNTSAVDIAAGDYVVSDAASTATGNALPAGLTLTMNDLNPAQDQCQGATINLTVGAS